MMVMTPFLAACHNDSITVKNGSCTHFYPNSSAIYAVLPEKYCQSTKSKKDIRCCAHTQSDEDNYDLTTRGLTRPISVRRGLCKTMSCVDGKDILSHYNIALSVNIAAIFDAQPSVLCQLPSRYVFSWVIGFRGQLSWRLFSHTRQNLAADACL